MRPRARSIEAGDPAGSGSGAAVVRTAPGSPPRPNSIARFSALSTPFGLAIITSLQVEKRLDEALDMVLETDGQPAFSERREREFSDAMKEQLSDLGYLVD